MPGHRTDTAGQKAWPWLIKPVCDSSSTFSKQTTFLSWQRQQRTIVLAGRMLGLSSCDRAGFLGLRSRIPRHLPLSLSQSNCTRFIVDVSATAGLQNLQSQRVDRIELPTLKISQACGCMRPTNCTSQLGLLIALRSIGNQIVRCHSHFDKAYPPSCKFMSAPVDGR